MSPAAQTVIHHRMLRTATHLVDHPAIVSVYLGDDDSVEAITAAGRRLLLVADEHRIQRPSATRVTMSVGGRRDDAVRPSFDELLEPTRAHRAVNLLLGRTVITQAAQQVLIGERTLEELLGPSRQLRGAGDQVGGPAPLEVPALRLGFPGPGVDPATGACVEVLVQADGVVSCSGPGDPTPEITQTWLSMIDRHAAVEPGAVRAALTVLAQQVFTDPDLAATTGRC